MVELLQGMASAASKTWNVIVVWVTSAVTWLYNFIDRSLYLHHSLLAHVFVVLIIILLLLVLYSWGWKRVPKPKAPEEKILVPRPYRLLFLGAVLGFFLLAAFFYAMTMD